MTDPRCAHCGREREDHYQVVGSVANGEEVVIKEPGIGKDPHCPNYVKGFPGQEPPKPAAVGDPGAQYEGGPHVLLPWPGYWIGI